MTLSMLWGSVSLYVSVVSLPPFCCMTSTVSSRLSPMLVTMQRSLSYSLEICSPFTYTVIL